MDWPEIAAIVYTVAWSVSFYGQIYDNWKLKNVQGFSLDYLILNINGYVFYGIYSTMGYFTDIQGAGTVVVADLIFVYHSLLMVFVETIQVCIYPHGKNRISYLSILLAICLWIIILLQIFFTVYIELIPWQQHLNPLSTMGYAKILLSFIKYSPAVYWNWKRKSTKGWSIFNILLDLVGGCFSMASGGISVQNGLNITKLVLGILTIVYDLIFVFQHYVLYYPKKQKKNDNNADIEQSMLKKDEKIVDNNTIQNS